MYSGIARHGSEARASLEDVIPMGSLAEDSHRGRCHDYAVEYAVPQVLNGL